MRIDRRRGRRVTFRVGKAMFAILDDVATSMGSSVAEFCQALILTGLIFEYAQFEDTNHLGEFVSAVRGNKLAGQVGEENPLKGVLTSLSRTQINLVSGPSRNRPHIEGSRLIKVRLPPNFVHRIDLYAKLTNATRSAILTRFFERGLLLYMCSQRNLMRVMAEAIKARAGEP
jgi:hypothetical protein